MRADGFIPYGCQSIDEDDIQAVVDVLRSPIITQGPTVRKFEQAFAEKVGAKYAVAVNSATSALHIACMAANLSEGDELITSPNTFVASANCGVYCGAKPVFADIDPRTYNIDPIEVENRLNKDTRIIVPVHFAGQSADMKRLKKLADAHGTRNGEKIYLVEDASHALGSFYFDTPVGACEYSDVAVFSFHPVKHITTGEGGIAVTNDRHLYERMQMHRSHGITQSPEYLERKSPGPWHYQQVILGHNYRITDIQCALGLRQLEKLDQFVRRRREVVDQYNEALAGVPNIIAPFEAERSHANFHLYVLQIDFERVGISRTALMTELREKKIGTQVHYIPVHTQPYFQKHFGYKDEDYPQALAYYSRCLSFPLYPKMTRENVDHVVSAIKRVTCR